jgi:hypothetical protein
VALPAAVARLETGICTIDGGEFHAEFEFEDLHLPNDGSDDRRQRVLRARYGNKTVIYPGLRAGNTEYRHKP